MEGKDPRLPKLGVAIETSFGMIVKQLIDSQASIFVGTAAQRR